ncbi:type IV secretion system protein B4 [Gymnodinialimonas sp. 2305UL16-5]|uniref:VirB4 family type IV secretion/conjugal transfer ATPase n=1 Tax=Gymnodinialimonas mytili TaxID=3126503 RepID=UPI0030AB0AFE
MALEVRTIAEQLAGRGQLLQHGYAHLPYVSLVNDKTLRLRDNSLMCCIRLDGLNSTTAADEDLDGVKSAFARAIAQLGPDYTIYTHRVSRRVDPVADLDPLNDNDFCDHVDRRWSKGLAERKLRDRTLTISIIRTRRLKRTFNPFVKAANLIEGADQKRDLEHLEETVRLFRAALGNDRSRVLTEPSGEVLGFLGSILTANETPIYHPNTLNVIGDVVFGERVTFVDDGFVLSDGPFGERVGITRALKDYPPNSWCTIFDGFALPCDYVISQSFVPMSNNQAAELVERKRKVMQSTADIRTAASEQLAKLHEQVMVREKSLGSHSLTVSLISDDEASLRERVSDLEGLASNFGARFVADRVVNRAHFFAQFPGNMAGRPRTNLITNTHFANFASLHRTPMGKAADQLPWRSPITVFPTNEGGVYRFSFHRAGAATSEPPAGHTVILGETGSGKSVLAALLLTFARRTGARVFAFDYRKGLEMAVRAMRGTYSVVESGRPTGLNPLWVETDPEGVDWMTDWLSRILKPGGQLSAAQGQEIRQNVVRNAESTSIDVRQWSPFTKLFASTDDGGELQGLLSEWGPGGRYGWVFGETKEDSFSLDGDVMGFDLTHILDAQSERERMAVLSYIFRRVERQLKDRRRTIVLIDEAWKAIDNEYFATVIQSWLASLRKQNAVVVMLAQNAGQLAQSKVGERIFSFFPTQIIFPDAKSSAGDYQALRLNASELAAVTARSNGRNFLLRDDQASVIIDGDASCLGDLLHVLGGGAAGAFVAGDTFRETPDFWRKLV